MANWRQRLKSRAALCALWVALCFGLTSAAYLSWLHRLTALALGTAADWLSMGAGYLLQAAGMGIAAQRLRRAPDADHSRTFAACALLFAALCAPALLGVSAAAVIAFGLGMNLACGIIAGYYLFAIAGAVEPGHRGFAFGGGYALATVAVGLLALVGRGAFLHGPWALPLVIALAAVAAVFARRSGLFGPFEAAPEPDQPPRPAPDGLVALAFGTIVLISDAVVVALSAVVYGSLENALYAVIAIFTSTKLIDAVVFGLSRDNGKLLIIITTKPDEISDLIISGQDRGLTLIEARGGYSKAPLGVILCAVRPHDAYRVRQAVMGEDEHSFIITATATAISGLGFGNEL